MLFFQKLCAMGVNPTFMMVASIILCISIPYFLGSLNFGIILSEKLYHEDVRSKGSGNAGSTNMLRNYGKKAAIMTLVGDAVKTAVSCGFGLLVFGIPGMYISGLFCMVGHMFPLYYKFKGGKGIVCLAVIVLCTDWRVFLILFSIFIILILGTKYVSLGSVIGAMLYPIVLNRLNRTGIFSIELIAVIIAALIVFKHKDNIVRLANGTENKFSFGNKKSEAAAAQQKTENMTEKEDNSSDGDAVRSENNAANTSKMKSKKKK